MAITYHPSAETWQERYLRRGIARTALVTPSVMYDPMYNHATNWTENNSNGDCTVENTTGFRGGVTKMDTTATAASRASLRGPANAWVNVPTTEAWYFACKFSVDTVPTSVTSMALPGMLSNGAGQTPRVGVEGVTSLTKYVLTPGTGTAVASSVTIDTAVHTVEFWGAGTTAYFASVDDETPITGTHGGSTVGPYYPYIQLNNGAGAVATQTAHIYEFLALTGSS